MMRRGSFLELMVTRDPIRAPMKSPSTFGAGLDAAGWQMSFSTAE